MAEPYVRSEFKVTAEIDGITFNDVVGMSATFGLNSIPSATLHVASGKDVYTGNEATIHSALDKLRPRTKATVTLSVKTTGGEKEKKIGRAHV